MKKQVLVLLAQVLVLTSVGQQVPATEENIPYLVTFGADADPTWGDDDFSQVFFFVIPEDHMDPVYIRIFDPGTGGEIDEKKGSYNTKTKYSIYGGVGCITEDDARGTEPTGNYDSGNLLATKSFENEMDNEWYSFGPFNPTSGELAPTYGGYVIKVIAEGTAGDDGNLYKYFLSTSADINQEIEGGNAFTFEYTFRMHDEVDEVSHVYPYIDGEVISVKQGNFDWDHDGHLKIVTNSRHAIRLDRSGDGNWVDSEHDVLENEKESTFDVQFHKNTESPAKNNNIGFYITNQYGEALPFYTIPIGGVPKPPANIKLDPKR